MAAILAIALALGGVVMLAAYNGTAHVYNGIGCGPIDVFGYAFSVDMDCVTISNAELVAAVACFGLAVLVLAFGRGGSEHSRW